MIIKKYNEILKNLESHLFNLKDLDYVKKQITELTMVYINEIDKKHNINNKKFNHIERRLLELESKMEMLDEGLEGELEEVDEAESEGEKINCPYCNYNFPVEYEGTNQEINCPNCDNLIVLDWGEFEDDM